MTTTHTMTDAPAGFIAVSVPDPVSRTPDTIWVRASSITEVHETPDGRAYIYLNNGSARYVLESPAEVGARLTRAIYGALERDFDHDD